MKTKYDRRKTISLILWVAMVYFILYLGAGLPTHQTAAWSPTEEISPEPSPTDEISPEPSPTEEISPEPSPTDEISPEPSPTDEISPEPSPTDEISPEPSPTDEISPEPSPTEEISPEPSPTDEISPEPTPTLEPFPQRITSEEFFVNQDFLRISRIAADLTADQFRSLLNEGAFVRIFSGAIEITGSQPVGTGMTAVLMQGNDIVRTYYIVVTGDINGDGKITLTDFVQLQSHLLKMIQLGEWSFMAADLNGGGVTITDFVMMQSHLLGKLRIIPRIH